MTTSSHPYYKQAIKTMAVILIATMTTTTIIPARLLTTPTYQTDIITLTFNPTSLTTHTQNGYDILTIPDATYPGGTGAPHIPAQELIIAVPATTTITSIQIQSTTTTPLPGTYTIPGNLPPQTLNQDNPLQYTRPATPINQPTYPSTTVQLLTESDLYGQGLAHIRFNPIQYHPATKTITITTSLTIKLLGIPSRTVGDYLPGHATPSETQAYTQQVQGMVQNPNAVHLQANTNPHSTGVDPGDYDYVIITSSSWMSAFQPLADWKTQKGVPATIVNTTWIYSEYSGSTNQAKIKAFIQDAYTTWGATFFLIGGDTDTVPAKTTTFPNVDSDPVPNDTYYADFDGDWTIEVNIGRASVTGTGSGNGKIGNFINKILTYEQNPPSSYPKYASMFGFDLDSSTHAEQCKQTIDNTYIPSNWTMTNVYDSNSGDHYTNVMSALNAGQNIINHADHSGSDCMGVGYVNHNELLYESDMDSLTNGNKQSILYSMGCDPCAFDNSNCIAEHFVRNNNGGGIAFIGNTRYGWYEYGTYDTLSMGFDQAFFHSLFTENYYKLGQAFTDHKNDEYQNDDYYQYIFTELTLLGDPELPVWKDNPLTFSVTHPDTLPTGSSSFTVHVSHSGTAVANALVCLWKGTEVYLTGTTNSGGDITFNPAPSTAGTMSVTITKQNYLPSMTNATVYVSDNTPPEAFDDTATVTEDSTNNQINVLANDHDDDGDPITIISVTQPSHGQSSQDGAYAYYTPEANYHGPDSFTYTIADTWGATDTATVSITVTDVNDPPTASFTHEPATVHKNEPVYLNSTSTDIDGTIVNWTWSFGDGTAGYGEKVIHTYQNAQDFTVTLTVTDDDGAKANASTSITISPLDETAPSIVVVKPVKNMLYLMDTEIISLSRTIVIGSLTVVIHSEDLESGVNHVVISIDGQNESASNQGPDYQLYWSTPAFGTKTLHIVATDNAGNENSTDLTVFKLF